MPGTYTVRLTVDGKTLVRSLQVRMDPRVKATAADLKSQFDASRALDAGLRRVADAIRSQPAAGDVLIRLQGQLTQLFGIVEATDGAPTPQTLSAIEETLIAVERTITAR